MLDSFLASSGGEVYWSRLTSLGLLVVVGIFVSRIIYNLYFHPLRNIPGPKFAAISNAAYSYWFLSGHHHTTLLDLHKKYGHAVRTAPNEVSFNSAQSFKDIYGFRKGHKTFVKGNFYSGGTFAARGVSSLVSERDPAKHGEMRRLVAHAFSNTSLAEQKDIIVGGIDRFINMVKTKAVDQGQVLDMCKAYEKLTFDIIGDLAFGQPFGAIENDEPHPWIETLLSALTKGAMADTFNRFPAVASLVKLVLHKQLKKLFAATALNEQYAIDLVKKRIDRDTDRKDFMTRILENRDKVSDLQLAAHSWDFVAAGSETGSTALSTCTYYMLRDAAIEARLKAEVRGAFSSASQICDETTKPLKYLTAVCLEAMRIFPPLPLPLPRYVPEGGDTVDGHYLPAGTQVTSNHVAACLDPANFKDPTAFRPERWLNPDGDSLEASQPFSLGPRVCIGKNLAWMEMRTSLAKVVWTFDMKLVDPSINWLLDSQMHSLWMKPPLNVTAKLAVHDAAKV